MTRRAIKDKFTKLKTSRQRKHILRRKVKGKCLRCGMKAVNKNHCEIHRLEANAYAAKWVSEHPEGYAKAQMKYWRGRHGAC